MLPARSTRAKNTGTPLWPGALQCGKTAGHLLQAGVEPDGDRFEIMSDGHDRGQKVIASAFADIGFDVDMGPLFATADEAARQAVENDVHILGLSSLAAAHLTTIPEQKAALKKQGREDIMIIIGGVVPPQDYDELYKAVAEAIYPPGTVISEAAEELFQKLNTRIGYFAVS
jgi:methylmalonyl-CoA mutase